MLVIVPTVAAQGAPSPGTYVFAKHKRGHTARVVIRTRAFDPTKHKITYLNKGWPMVDGRLAYGAESTPRTEIAAFEFYFDGQRIPVDRLLYSDCYELNIYRGDGLVIRFSRDLQRVFASAAGADGAGTYDVTWVLARNGHHRGYKRLHSRVFNKLGGLRFSERRHNKSFDRSHRQRASHQTDPVLLSFV